MKATDLFSFVCFLWCTEYKKGKAFNYSIEHNYIIDKTISLAKKKKKKKKKKGQNYKTLNQTMSL
jgi:hypothetical protein